MTDCLFCRIVAGDIAATVVHESERTLAFRDIAPKAPIHVLVIPKEHYADVVALAADDAGLAGEVMAAVAIVAEKEGLLDQGFRTVFNTGESVGQSVFHAHAHVLGGRAYGDL